MMCWFFRRQRSYNILRLLDLLAYGSKQPTSQKQSKSMSLKLKTAKFGLLGTSHEFKQSLTWGQSAVVTGCQLLAHTLMPAPPPPLPVFSFLLPVVPPECMPNCSFPLQNQRNWFEKGWKNLSTTTPAKNMFCLTLVKYCTCTCTVLQFEQKWHLAPDARVVFDCVLRC